MAEERKIGQDNPKIRGLEKQADQIAAEISNVRKSLIQNEAYVRKRIAKKINLDDELNRLLRQSFSKEKSALSRVRRKSQKKQSNLQERIKRLEKITAIYDQKKTRISDAKKRYQDLKKMLDRLEDETGVWDSYA